MTSTKTALILSGGGALGISQVGMLKAWKELGCKADYVITSSVGTLNGLMYVQDQLELLEELWLKISNKDVYTFNPINIFTKMSLFDSKPLANTIKNLANIEKLKQSNLVVCVTDMQYQQAVWIPLAEQNKLLPAESFLNILLASASPPVAFPLVTLPWEGRKLIAADGGLLADYPVFVGDELGCNEFVIMTPHSRPNKVPKNFADVIEIALEAPQNGTIQSSMLLLPEDISLTIIRPGVESDVGLLSFDSLGSLADRKKLIQGGYESALKILGEKS